jgi:hypothetical protein
MLSSDRRLPDNEFVVMATDAEGTAYQIVIRKDILTDSMIALRAFMRHPIFDNEEKQMLLTYEITRDVHIRYDDLDLLVVDEYLHLHVKNMLLAKKNEPLLLGLNDIKQMRALRQEDKYNREYARDGIKKPEWREEEVKSEIKAIKQEERLDYNKFQEYALMYNKDIKKMVPAKGEPSRAKKKGRPKREDKIEPF